MEVQIIALICGNIFSTGRLTMRESVWLKGHKMVFSWHGKNSFTFSALPYQHLFRLIIIKTGRYPLTGNSFIILNLKDEAILTPIRFFTKGKL